MTSGHLKRTLILISVIIAVAGGCSRKIVRPQAPPVSPGIAPYSSGQVLEQEMQIAQNELKTVYFDFDQYTLSNESQSALQFNSQVLKEDPQFKSSCRRPLRRERHG